MNMALELAKKGMGYTAPNPMVGCVVVKDKIVIATGYHERIGGYHAERNALLTKGIDFTGAELYVTLEPCCHFGKTPPCTEIIIEKKIRKVYVGALDNNPLVSGKGIQQLKDAGIEVETGILKEECEKLNEVFFHYMRTKQPFVAMKYAMTLDGKIACEGGDSMWVTSECARVHVQQLRKYYTGIMAGIGTVLSDNPSLTCRVNPCCNPIRIICDSKLRIPMECNIIRTAKDVTTYVAYGEKSIVTKAQEEKKKQLEQMGVHLLGTDSKRVDLAQLMQLLGELKIDSILLEGGGTLNSAMLRQQFVHRVYAYIAPKLVGGKEAKTPVEGNGISFMRDAVVLKEMELFHFETDIMLTGRVQNKKTGSGSNRNL